MSTRNRQDSKKMLEKFLIEEFLDYLGIEYEHLDMTAEETAPGPDAKVDCLVGGSWVRVGIELTTYQVDAKQKSGSQARQIREVWDVIHQQLKFWSESAPQAPFFKWSVNVFFNDSNPPRTSDAEKLAKQLIRAVQFGLQRELRQKEGFALIYQKPLVDCVKEILIHPVVTVQDPVSVSGIHWRYNSVAVVGIVKKRVLEILSDKTVKREGYDWTGCDERWLLICASGKTPHDRAGLSHEGIKIHSSDIVNAARNSGFDRVYFWEKVCKWHEEILAPAAGGRGKGC